MNNNGYVHQRNGKWYYVFEAGQIDGKRKRIERVCKNATNQSSAMRELIEAQNKFSSTGIVQNSSIDEISVADFAKQWIDNYVNSTLMPSTAATYRYKIAPFVKHYGIYKLKSVSTLTVQEYCKKLYDSGYCEKTVKGNFRTLQSMFSYATNIVKNIQYNPCNHVKLPKPVIIEENKNHVFSDDDITKIFETLKQDNYIYYIIVLIAYLTGAREGEILGLQDKNVDLKNGVITIENNLQYVDRKYILKLPKNESSIRKIAISDFLLDELKKWHSKKLLDRLKYANQYKQYYIDRKAVISENKGLQKVDFFICRECGSYIPKSSLIDYMKEYCKKKGIKYTTHSFRHTHATELIENGVPVKAVQDRLGHKNIATTLDIYAEATKKMEEQVLDVLNKKRIPSKAANN